METTVRYRNARKYSVFEIKGTTLTQGHGGESSERHKK